MLLNIVIDFVMLTAMALVSISGFILEIVIPSRHAVKFQAHYVDLHMQAYPTNLFFIILAHSFPFVYHGRRNLS